MSILHATGYDDLATIAADRIAWTATQWGNPLAVGLAAHTRTSSMLRHGTYDVGLRLTDSARAVLDAETGHHFMDVARAYLWQGRHEQALASLQRARELAPQQTRHHPTTREVLRMLVRAHRHTNKPLARFNAWIGAGG